MILSAISILSPLLGVIIILFAFIKLWNKEIRTNLKKYTFPLAFFFGTIGYTLRYVNPNDLTRYFEKISKISNSLIETLVNDDQRLYINDILFHFIKIANNDYLLPFIVGFVCYLIVFYVLFDLISNSSRIFKGYEIISLIIFCVGMVPTYSIITNVRCVLAYLIMSFAIYMHSYKKKFNVFTIICYIIPLGLHSSAIIILLLRILSMILKKVSKVAIVFSLFLPSIVDFLHLYVNRIGLGIIGGMLKNAVNKAYYYLYWNEGGWATQIESSISNIFTRITGTIMLLVFIFIILKNSNKKLFKKEMINLPMINYLFFVSVFALGCLSIKTGAFWRFNAIVMLFSPVIIVQALENEYISKKSVNYIYIYGYIVFAINLVYQFRNIDLITSTVKLITTSGLEIIYHLLRSIAKIL